MLAKATRLVFQPVKQRTALFSQAPNLAKLHEKKHLGAVMDPKFYENDFLPGKDGDLEIVHSPFYDLAHKEKLSPDAAGTLIDNLTRKLQYVEGMEVLLQPPVPTKENVAYTRYADHAEERKDLFQFPRGKPFEIVNKAELFRVQRWSTGADKWASIRRSKSFFESKFLPPFALKEGNMRALLANPEAPGWKQAMLDGIPRLNHDVLV